MRRAAVTRRAVVAICASALAAPRALGQTLENPADGEEDHRLVDAARAGAPLAELLRAALPDLKPDTGTCVVWKADLLFVARTQAPTSVSIDGKTALPMSAAGEGWWVRLESLRQGRTYNYDFAQGDRLIAGETAAGYADGSYRRPGVARGSLSPMRSVESRLYCGAVSDYWLYVNAGVDSDRGAPLMIWFDGAMHVGRRDARAFRLQTVSDNLVAQGQCPPMVHLLIRPGRGGPPLPRQFAGQPQDNAMRSLQYDTFSPLFAQHVAEEVLPRVEREVKLRRDAYSRGAAGQSSGAMAAFKLGWFRPDAFSRIHSTIGSYTALQGGPGRDGEGGDQVALRVRREARRNLRIWMSDGSNDLDRDANGRADLYAAGSWPLANIAVAQALKSRLYDMRFRFGEGRHNPAQGGLDLPESLAWLWRDYDPERTRQDFEQDPAERARPAFRVRLTTDESR